MKKATIFTVAAALLIFHFFATVLYLAPANPVTKFYIEKVSNYIEPIFTQNWGLFAPEPATVSLQLWYRCQTTDQAWTEWQDPVYELFRYHHRFPLTYRGKLTYIYQSIARDLLNTSVRINKAKKCFDSDCASEVENELRELPNYTLAVRFVRDLCYSQFNSKVNTIEFQVMKVFPIDYSKRHAKGEIPRFESLRFKPVSFVESQKQASNN